MHIFPWGGSEELWTQAAIRLSHEGHEVWASVVYWPRLSERVTALRQHGIHLETHFIYRAGFARSVWNNLTANQQRAYGRLKRLKPDLVVISQGFNQGGFGWASACREAGIPYALIVHCNSEYWWFREEYPAALATYPPAKRVFFVSRHNLDLLCLQLGEPLPNAEVAWNPYNVSTEPPPPWPHQSAALRLACVARIDPGAKGQDLLLRTLARPEWRNRPVELNLFGAGPDEVPLRRLAANLGLNNVHFRGHVADIRTIWKENHLLVLPSRYEGLPLALVEAMWCGRPAVVTNVGGNAELCLDGETGFVAAAAAVPSIAVAMERAWEHRQDWPRMGEAARARIETQLPRDPVGLFCERLRACAEGAEASS